ncbi:hypothetical protein ACHAWF_018320 [Thalassiosira exigua]
MVTTRSKKFKAAAPEIARLRLEAIFHPKFENEAPDAEIRRKMLANASAREGYLEASLKHSGSLILWSGRQRFYSKNSTDNVHTRVGEIVLTKHFARCYGEGWREEYERCSEFVRANRLTCSFEVVTSILGHHGDLPKGDYLILIAVADRRCGGRFHSTDELVRFAQRFRLPHNDAWIFPSGAACESLFSSYDEMMETGTAKSVIDELDRIVSENEEEGCSKVVSLYPHDSFQGEILEGIVIRYVPYASDENEMDRRKSLDEMKELSAASAELLRLVPPSQPLPVAAHDNQIQLANLRALAESEDFEILLRDMLESHHGSNFRNVERSTKCVDVVQVANEILHPNPTNATIYDKETLEIAQLIRTLDRLNVRVSFKLLNENPNNAGSESRCLCIVHVHHDAAFPKYNAFLKREGSGGMPLFRGFSIELVSTSDLDNSSGLNDMVVDETTQSADPEANEEKLMLKMKFLPYMVRTFICRNGLSILQGSGDVAFVNYAISQLTKWHVSDASMRKWVPFFRGWAKYCLSPPDSGLPPLTERTYLHQFNEYSDLFASGKIESAPDNEPSFNGLIVLVGYSKNSLDAISLVLSKQLNCSKIVRDIRKVTERDVLLSMQPSGGGLICVTGIVDGHQNVRKLAKQYQKSICIIFVEGDTPGASDKQVLEFKGRTQGWKRTKCNMLFILSKEASTQANEDEILEYFRTDPTANAMMEKLKESSSNNQRDERPGLVVYFPSIPGSGKSSLCENITAKSLGAGDRHVVLFEGDQVKKNSKGKYFDVVANEILAKPASISLLDKNIPPPSFVSVHTVCIESRSIGLPVLFAGMEDTLVGNGASAFVYPFSLRYLAVCMSRVLARKPNTHKGKLDSATPNACMVVTQFYCFYRHITVEKLKEKLLNIGCRTPLEDEFVSVPFFRDALVDIPSDLKSSLEDAIMLQTRDDLNFSKIGDEESKAIEERLRSAIRNNQVYISGLTVSLEESKRSLESDLSRIIASLPLKIEPGSVAYEPAAKEPDSRTIKIASLDLNYEALHAELDKVQMEVPELEHYFAQRKTHKDKDENDKSQDRFIHSVHCTFAHASQVTQAAMKSTFENLVGTKVGVKAIALLFSDDLAAIEVEIPDEASIPRLRNDFHHVTMWCAKGAQAYQSNQLPNRVSCGEAKKIVFEEPFSVQGVFSFWYY